MEFIELTVEIEPSVLKTPSLLIVNLGVPSSGLIFNPLAEIIDFVCNSKAPISNLPKLFFVLFTLTFGPTFKLINDLIWLTIPESGSILVKVADTILYYTLS